MIFWQVTRVTKGMFLGLDMWGGRSTKEDI